MYNIINYVSFDIVIYKKIIINVCQFLQYKLLWKPAELRLGIFNEASHVA